MDTATPCTSTCTFITDDGNCELFMFGRLDFRIRTIHLRGVFVRHFSTTRLTQGTMYDTFDRASLSHLVPAAIVLRVHLLQCQADECTVPGTVMIIDISLSTRVVE
jgi:hypothetical protein